MTKFALGAGGDVSLGTLVDTRLLVQANSGGGKSWCVRRILEQTHGHVQHLVIDPEGEFSTLRERFDYVLAARHGGDTAADPRVAKLLAERLLDLGASAILDIYELKAHERVRFVRAFLEALVDAPKKLWHPALVVVDEAHVYCPQAGEAESAGAVIDLATRGRKRGFCAVLATQRLAKLHKDAAAECNNVLVGRTSLDVDMKRAADILGLVGREEMHALRSLEPGEFFAFGPAVSPAVSRVRVGPVDTVHPKAGSRIAFTPPPPSAKVVALLPKLADLPAEAEEREKSMADLKRDVAELRRKLTIAEKAMPEAKVERVEIPVLPSRDLERIEAAGSALAQAARDATQAARDVEAAVRTARAAPRPAATPRLRTPATPPRPAPVLRAPRSDAPSGDVSPARQRVLDSLAYLETIGVTSGSRVQVAFLAGASPKSSAYQNNVSGLHVGGFLEYVAGGALQLTDAGRAEARAPDQPPTTEALHALVQAKMQPARWRVLRALLDAYPDALTRAELGERAAASPASSAFQNNVSGLRTMGLVDYRDGGVVALPVLFLEA